MTDGPVGARGDDDRVRPDLHDLADEVEDEVTFIRFLFALATDRAAEVEHDRIAPTSPYGSGSRGWENQTTEDFLFAAAAWASESRQGLPTVAEGVPGYQPPLNPWKRCAQIMLMGKHYE
jgi:hypothetical protein